VEKILVEEGQQVKSGELLITLEKRIEELEVERRRMIAENKTELRAAEQRQQLLKNEWETTRRLFETTKSVSQEDRDRKELEFHLASAEVERILAQEMQEEVEYKMAQEHLTRREIRSPMDGRVTRIHLHEGEGCDPRQPLISLVDNSRCEFVANMPVSLAAQLRVEARVVLIAETGNGRVPREGYVFYISPVVDPASGLQEVKVRFDNVDGAVPPGVIAHLTRFTAEQE